MKKKKPGRAKDRAESEALLIEAAAEVFSAHGYEGATTRMIAARSGVNLGLISRYFGSKEGIFAAVVKGGAEVAAVKGLAYPEQATLLDECLVYSEEKFNSIYDGYDFAKIIVLQTLTSPEFVASLKKSSLANEASNFEKRILRFFKGEKNVKAAQARAKEFGDAVERLIYGTMVIQSFVNKKSREESIEAIKASIRAFEAFRS